MATIKLISVIGNRPQFIKLVPITRAIAAHNSVNRDRALAHKIVHTGQHYSFNMSDVFFEDLGLPMPEFDLGVGPGSQGWQTGEMLKRIEGILLDERPDIVLVYGDTNSTLAGALAAAKLHIPLVHIEAGLRSYNRAMPEEMNRVLTDHCADLLFCPTRNAVTNLRKEGFVEIVNDGELLDISETDLRLSRERMPMVVNVGDVMYDSLLISRDAAEEKSRVLEKYALTSREYFLVTIHRAENTDNLARLKDIIAALVDVHTMKPVVFPIHPRTKKALAQQKDVDIDKWPIKFTDPVSYYDMLVLEKHAAIVLTDSGGVQREAFLLGIPCLILREETEWVELLEWHSMRLAGVTRERIMSAMSTLDPAIPRRRNTSEALGDGRAAKRIIRLLARMMINGDIT